MEIKQNSAEASGLTQDNEEKLDYERRVAGIEKQIRILDQEIRKLELIEKLAKEKEEKENSSAQGEKEDTDRKTKKTSRRKFIKQGTRLVVGMMLGAEIIGDNKNMRKVPAPPTEKKSPEKTLEEEIEDCRKIIKNEKFEEILKNPRLVSALYYSQQAIENMAPPHESRTQKVIWSLHSLITKEFRDNYIQYLKNLVKEQISHRYWLNLHVQSLPLDKISFGKDIEENHQDAIDLFIEEGSPIRSMSGGIVVLAENGWKKDDKLSTSSAFGGNTIIIFSPYDESFYRYAHMEEAKVGAGTVLSRGEQIGTVGHTGINASKKGHGRHLHLEINKYDRKNGKIVPCSVVDLKNKLETLLKRIKR